MNSSAENIASCKVRTYIYSNDVINYFILINRLPISFGQRCGSPHYFVFKKANRRRSYAVLSQNTCNKRRLDRSFLFLSR